MSEQLPGRAILFDAKSLDGEIREQSGLLHLPDMAPPRGGYPVVVFGHMTTGASAAAAPSLAAPGHPEWRRISQGDALCVRLLKLGIAVLRPDYEGIGPAPISASPMGGASNLEPVERSEARHPHPYLIAPSLAESMLAIMRARRSIDERLGNGWVAAGHSEGAFAALHASVLAEPDEDATLLGTAAFAPPTRMDLSIGLARHMPGWVPGAGVVSALIGLMLSGAATEDERIKKLVTTGGLSLEARNVWADIDTRPLTELAAKGSWGDVAPSKIASKHQRELWQLLFESFKKNEIANLAPSTDPAQNRIKQPPVRIDAARFDEVAPAPLAAAMMRRYRKQGFDLTTKWWPTHHSGVMHDKHAPSQAANWIAERFGRLSR